MSFHEVLKKDFALLDNIQNYFAQRPQLNHLFSLITSKHPLNDICSCIYILYGFGILEFGFDMFWVGALNLFAVFVLNNLIQAARPVEVNEKYQPQCNTSYFSFGFPSIESHMAVVILFYWVYLSKQLVLLPLAVVLIILIGLTRLWAYSRFPHQILLSWCTGFIGSVISTLVLSFINLKRFAQSIYLPL